MHTKDNQFRGNSALPTEQRMEKPKNEDKKAQKHSIIVQMNFYITQYISKI